MRTRFARQLIVTIVALFVGMGMVLSAVQANDMVVKMAAAGDAGSADANACTACGGNEGDAQQANCPPACMANAFALLPATTVIAINVTGSPSIYPYIPPRESAGVPDLSPPRISILG